MQHYHPHHPHHVHHYSTPLDCCSTCHCTPCRCSSCETVALDSYVSVVVNAINTCCITPYGDYGGPTVYYFTTMCNGLGNIVYTVFDKQTTLGLASFMVRYGAASTIRQILFEPFPRSQIDLQFLILPCVPIQHYCNGTVTP
jgi:hypothetical protein